MKNKKRKAYTIALVFFLAVLVVLIVLVAEKYVISEETAKLLYGEEEMEALLNEARMDASASGREELLDEIRTSFEDGSSVLETLRPYYPDDIVLASGGAYHFVPIMDTLAQNDYVQENLNILESGEYQYLLDEEVVSRKGIDVSSHQGTIDWQRVAGDGVEFAFIRAAYRGYGTGKLVEDEQFDANMSGAIAAGIEVGVYVYTQAVNEEEILEEAALAIEKASAYTDSCVIVVDVEKGTDSSARMNALSPEERTALVQLFCDTVEAAGYKPMIYFNLEMSILMLNIEELEDYDKWFAAYTDTFYFPYAYDVWQYSEAGTVDGINGNVDLNISFSN